MGSHQHEVGPKEKEGRAEGVEIQKGTRGKINRLVLLQKLEKSIIGKQMLKVLDVKSIAEILEDEELLTMAICRSGMVEPGEFEDALMFLVIASKESPGLVREYLSDPHFDKSLRERLIGEMGWNASELQAKTTEKAKGQAKAKRESKKAPKERLENLAAAKKLEKTEVFNEVLRLVEADSIEGLLRDSEKLNTAISRLEWDHDNVEPQHFGAFVLLAAERSPKLVFDFFAENRYAEIRHEDSKKAVVKLLVGKGFPATIEMFEPPVEHTEPSEGRKAKFFKEMSDLGQRKPKAKK